MTSLLEARNRLASFPLVLLLAGADPAAAQDTASVRPVSVFVSEASAPGGESAGMTNRLASLLEAKGVRIVTSREGADVAVAIVSQKLEPREGFVVRLRVDSQGSVTTVEGICGLGGLFQDRRTAWDEALENAADKISYWIEQNRGRLAAPRQLATAQTPQGPIARGVVFPMGSAAIREAIALGQQKPPGALANYSGVANFLGSGPSAQDNVRVTFQTPFARVALQARNRSDTPLKESDLPADALEPTLTVTAEVAKASAAGIEQILVLDAERPGPPALIQPTRVQRAASGARTAVFPLEVVKAGNELRIVLSDGRQATFPFTLAWVQALR